MKVKNAVEKKLLDFGKRILKKINITRILKQNSNNRIE